MIDVVRIASPVSCIGAIRAEAREEGFQFIERLVRDWQSDLNRFDREGEILLGSFERDQLVGVGGLNIDPYSRRPGVGRIRHLYVLRDSRRNGIARAILADLMASADGHFDVLRLRTDDEKAARLYEQMGFVKTNESDTTHKICLAQRGYGCT